MKLQGLTVSVGYDDLLAITLARNAPLFSRLCVITAPHDSKTIGVVSRLKDKLNMDGLFVHITDAFYANGALFNKGAAIEEVLATKWRDDMWSVIFDADIYMPSSLQDCLKLQKMRQDDLYCPRRRQVDDPKMLGVMSGPEFEFPAIDDAEHAGYFQMFHPHSRFLSTRPWYGTRWKHAGGCDSDFMMKFPLEHRHWMEFSVLHLGQHGKNWYGRVTPRWDEQQGSIGPTNPAYAEKMMKDMRRNRGKHKNDPYRGELL